MIDIIQGDAHDVASIMAVMEDAFDSEFGEAWNSAQCLSLLAMPGSKLLIARDGREVAGFAMTRWVLDEEELLMIGIAKSYQRKQVGGQLLGAVIEQAKTAGRNKLFLEVREGNTAEYFYQSSGFGKAGRRKDYYHGVQGKMYDAITMVRILK